MGLRGSRHRTSTPCARAVGRRSPGGRAGTPRSSSGSVRGTPERCRPGDRPRSRRPRADRESERRRHQPPCRPRASGSAALPASMAGHRRWHSTYTDATRDCSARARSRMARRASVGSYACLTPVFSVRTSGQYRSAGARGLAGAPNPDPAPVLWSASDRSQRSQQCLSSVQVCILDSSFAVSRYRAHSIVWLLALEPGGRLCHGHCDNFVARQHTL